MRTHALTPPRSTALAAGPSLIDAAARRAVLASLARLERGRLTVVDPEGIQSFEGPFLGPEVTLSIANSAFYTAVAARGSVGAGEAYIRGWWQADDLVGLVRLLVLNRETLESVDGGLARLAQPLLRAYHALRPNTLDGSRRNIAAHYDLSNDFFRLLLDETMTYSAGIFEAPGATLKDASVAKLDRICRKLRLTPSDHVLEIGTGWGSFAMHAALNYGCRVTTTTISREQYELARQRVQDRGLESRVTVLHQDYRKLEGRYDRIVSIEMIEAIGHEQFETFFRRCNELLEPDGALLLQSITIRDQFYETARRSVDFIKRYIFPGCCIPSIGALHQAASAASDMTLAHLEDIGPHYARTLAAWRKNLLTNADEIRALGFDDEFLRSFEFYLAYCEGGFAERQLGDVQMLLARPLFRAELPLPPARVMGG